MIDILSIALILTGLFFFFATTVGIIRLPDFYSRMHAAGKGDVLSSLLMLIGLVIYNLQHFSGSTVLVSLKIFFITAFITLASPTATHAIIDAGFESGISPWTKEKKQEDASDDMAT